MHTPACIYTRHSFFSLYPLIVSPRRPLVNMIFLNSHPSSRFASYFYFSHFVESRPVFSRATVTSLRRPHLFLRVLFLSSLLCVNLISIFSFLFFAHPFGAPLCLFLDSFIAPRLRDPFSIIIFPSAFSTLSSRTVFIVSLPLPFPLLPGSLNLLDTHRNSEIFIPRVSYLHTTGLELE